MTVCADCVGVVLCVDENFQKIYIRLIRLLDLWISEMREVIKRWRDKNSYNNRKLKGSCRHNENKLCFLELSYLSAGGENSHNCFALLCT